MDGRIEFIGENVTVSEHSDPSLCGVSGKIIGESRETITIESNGKQKMISKRPAKFMFEKTRKIVNEKKSIAQQDVMQELKLTNDAPARELIMPLKFRGERIVLPELVTNMTGFSELHNYKIKAKKGKLEIEEFKI